jgi:hypothetical protein
MRTVTPQMLNAQATRVLPKTDVPQSTGTAGR